MDDLKIKISEMEERFHAKCLIMNSPKVDAASSEIRELVSRGEEVSAYVGDQISEYIKEKNLYKIFRT